MTASMATGPGTLSWCFPAETTHDGMPLGNGLFGALLWGAGHDLRITINRADFWDHRGGVSFGPEATYANLRGWLEAGDEASLRRVFEGRGQDQPGQPPRPTRLPMGRVDLTLGSGSLARGALVLGQGVAQIVLDGSAPTTVEALVPRGGPVLAARVTGLAADGLRAVSAPPDAPSVRGYWEQYGFPAPQVQDGVDEGGWVQELPADRTLGVAWRIVRTAQGTAELYVAAEYGDTDAEARALAQGRVSDAAQQGYEALAGEEAAWWGHYWSECAHVSLPDAGLQETYELGMYKLAGLSMPGTPAATLQGPWVEEYRIPPWSSDYHFNINVQECYWPAYGGNQVRSLEPLWELVQSWLPILRENARQFLGIDDGLMLSHAVDDRCTGMGGFWTGAIDHGSTAWVGHMMWQYYLYTLDEGFLRDVAYPFMAGAMRAYESMLDRVASGGVPEGGTPEGGYALPVSVSPEYGGADMTAWGRNASFQLAIIHFLCRALARAAKTLGLEDVRLARWQAIDESLPIGSVAGEGDAQELQLWDGQPLAHSHRHHSHLASIYPFDVLDPRGNPGHRTLVGNSLRTWTRMGMGEWTGWCLPWAAILQARVRNGDRAVLLLEEQRRAFFSKGRASTHDAVISGLTIFDGRPGVMQVEASMGAAAAVLELLVHTAGGVLVVFPAVPKDWEEACFEGVRAEGAFLVSAAREAGHTIWVRVLSSKASHLRIENPFPGRGCAVRSNRRAGWAVEGEAGPIETDTETGEVIHLIPA
ncbi:MAG: glycosyl hydrolase family 95 catalytic domain-containing protein [Anaerolineae bacterium]